MSAPLNLDALEAAAWEEYPEPISDFNKAQWWVAELDAVAQSSHATADQKRAVAVVHHMLASAANAPSRDTILALIERLRTAESQLAKIMPPRELVGGEHLLIRLEMTQNGNLMRQQSAISKHHLTNASMVSARVQVEHAAATLWARMNAEVGNG